uniref:tRNA(His) guanylyltransferase n=1 Tax=Ciona savignyi TaxID=51511 RepID=H2YD63_CIOSA
MFLSKKGMIRIFLRSCTRLQLLQNYCKAETHQKMANSQFDYVKSFESMDSCLPNCWIVVRIDGNNFHKFSSKHNFKKPNDDRALGLMTRAARSVMELFNDVVLSYGQSDEYSFVFKKGTKTYNRRSSKLSSVVVSQFTSSYVYHWKEYFPDLQLGYPPAFDSRTVLYPSDKNLRDYLSWRQADCELGTLSSDKNEILFSQFGINYNNLPQLHRKGTVIVRDKVTYASRNALRKEPDDKRSKAQSMLLALNIDIIGKQFWEGNPHILAA